MPGFDRSSLPSFEHGSSTGALQAGGAGTHRGPWPVLHMEDGQYAQVCLYPVRVRKPMPLPEKRQH